MRLGHSMLFGYWLEFSVGILLSVGYLLGTQITYEEFMKKFHGPHISFYLWDGA